ncbi:MAG: carboxymuconolactone decarboxylase family protein [Frankiaceae bacterium]|nr:carboxymuconolactone decarboxylase family protein [Frankiaceae bacterium]MBV9872838.1 carboxymuconolactone decarboxylase family protein [Frankiaceae bacterium]
MARIDLPDGDQPDVVKALVLRPAFAKGVGAMNEACFASTLDWRLHELVRYRIAIINGCATCLSWRTPEAVEAGVTEDLLVGVADWRTSERYTDREKIALDFTEQFCGDSAGISDEFMARLGEHFDAGEIVELALVIGKYLSQGRFMQVLGLDQACVVPTAAP